MDLSKIPSIRKGPRKQHFKEDLDPVALDLKIGVLDFENPLRVEGDIEYMENDLLVDVRIEGTKKLVCSRCLDPFGEEFEKDVMLSFELDTREPINALPELGEELLVDHPIHTLCKADCKGLCERCGANRNHEKCKCKST